MKKPGSRFSVRVGGRRPLTLLLLLPVLAVFQGCSLDENPTSVITPGNFYQNEQEVMGGLASVYAGLRNTLEFYLITSSVTTDEIVVPTRGSDWFDNGRWIELHQQTWTANSPSGLKDMCDAWNGFFAGVADANVVMAGLENVTVADQEIVTAEIRTLRALYYFVLMDLFGGVPIVTDTEILARPRPTRAELFDFIEQELTQARNDLPTSWPSNMNGRLTQGAADAILANMYLNAEVFTGTVSSGGLQQGQARWQDAID
ncbi:MAG: RagB/SusD family nutrient uptake outer membrane protein, partial [Gemmatimonadota bacterium]